MKLDLLKLASSLKLEANLLLKKTQLIDKLTKYGKVVISGSYALDLMVDGDIDLFIINKKIDKEGSLKILNDLIRQDDFNGYMYYDWTKRRHEGFPNGYYLGLKTNFKNRKWKIDIWLLKSPYKKAEKLMNFVLDHLNEQNKKTILKLKHQAKTKKLDLKSSEIYKQVLYEK